MTIIMLFLHAMQAYNLYLRGELMGEIDVLLCPSTAEEKRTWLEKLQQAG